MVCVMVSGHQEYLADFLASTVSASIQILKNIRTVSPISYVQSVRTRLGGYGYCNAGFSLGTEPKSRPAGAD